MNEQEANQYLTNVLEGKAQVEGLEKKIASMLLSSNQSGILLEKDIQNLSAALEEARLRLTLLNGRREGYAQILLDAEKERRETAKPKVVPKAHVLNQEERKSLGDILGQQVDAAEMIPAIPSKRS